MRRLLVLLLCAGLALLGAPPVQASPPAVGAPRAQRVAKPPSAPRALSASGRDAHGLPRRAVTVSWKRPASAGSSQVRSYVVRLTPGSGGRSSSRVVVAAPRTRTTFQHLQPGRTYRISVRAQNKAGRGRAARLRYTLPVPAPAWVFAVDTAAKSIVRVPVKGGRAKTVAPRRTAWVVNAAGDVYVLDREARTVTRSPADGSPRRRVGSGFSDPTDVQLDAASNVYVVDGTRVVRMTRTGRAQRVVADPVFGAVFVGPDGAVSTVSTEFDVIDGDNLDFAVHVLTYPAAGGSVVRRTVRTGAYFVSVPGELLGDGAGNLFLHIYDTGGGGFRWWAKLADGSSTAVRLLTRDAYFAVAVDPRDRFHLMQTRDFCGEPNEGDGSCTPDLTVGEILTYPAAGTRTRTPVKPFPLQRTSTGGELLAVDRQGRAFLAQSAGPVTGLYEYGPKGGAPTRLASGAFLEPKRNN